jgi:hypothetical protein
MFPQQRFKLTRQALLLATVSAAFPVTGYCVAAGRADFVIGNVEAVAADGSRRPLAKGSEINSGEAISTAAGARAQVRFTDGGYVSLQPNSQFRVDQYQYKGKTDGEEKGFFSLLKGGLRAITGAIGHVNRASYRVATPAATIGIRGTGYNAVLGDGLTVSVADGIITLTNKGGTLILSQGQSAFVADMNTAPTLTFEQPSTPPAGLTGTDTPPLVVDDYVQGDCVGTCGGGGLGGVTVLTGVDAVVSGTTFGGSSLAKDQGGIVTFNSALGSEVSYVQAFQPAGAVTSFAGATLDTGANGSFPSAGYDGTIGWGRFYGTVSYTEPGASTVTHTFTADQGLHSVVGIATATMPTVGTAHYDLTGATRPTLASGTVAPGTVTAGGLDVYFNDSWLDGIVDLNIGGQDFSLSFSGSYSPGAGVSVSASVYSISGCSGSCSASVDGFFAGANAERAGGAYSITSTAIGTGAGDAIQGAVVYTRTANPALVQ